MRVYWLTLVLALLAISAGATTIVLPSDEQLADKAALIVTGRVLATEPYERDGAIWTDTTILVGRHLKGRSPDKIVVQEPGGTLGARITRVFGAPQFEEGGTVLLFLMPSASPGRYRVADLFAGKFDGSQTLDGRALWVRAGDAAEVRLLDSRFKPMQLPNVQRDGARFETFLRERVSGRAGSRDYTIENPVLARAFQGGVRDRGIRSNFTLIAEPNVYRWFRFGAGQTASWYHGGAQSGYSGNGVSELLTAISVWATYGQANIRYSYAGALPVAPKGLNASNGYNEVLFGDPLNEIAGSWNGTSGVVGTGGFSGVASGGTFNATFQADPAHPAGPIQAYDITEGNVTIQNGVAPASGVSNTELAEILAHELGHTLGFGHSASSDALMYASLTGLGPSLREDDRVAARWLYPVGGTAPPPPQVPAAPSGLTAVPSGNSVDLAWEDNAGNESVQSIFLAIGSGSFSSAGDVGANIRSVRLNGLAAGSYRVYVVASNAAGSSTPSNTATFTIVGVPAAAFSVSPQSGNAGITTFTFYDESKGTITSRLWSLGDGATATAAVVNHVYSTSGQFTVTLSVTGPGGTSSTTKSVLVSGPLSAHFEYSPANPTTSDTIQFTDQSGGAPTAWLWNFGDGTSSSEQNPSKQYATQGTFTVTLTTSRSGVSASTSKSLTVSGATPGTPVVVAAFDVSAPVAGPGTAIAFTDRSSGSPTDWSWSFGDGTTSMVQHPTHVYTATGTYIVTLTASRSGSTSSLSRPVEIAVAPHRSLVSAAAQTSGLGGTSWRTELSLYNGGLEGASVTMTFAPGQLRRTISLAPRQSITYENALFDLFGLSRGAGAIAIEAASPGSSAQLRVTSRTFTRGAAGTYGQSVPDIGPDRLTRTSYLTGMRSDDAYRTNLGLVHYSQSEGAASAGNALTASMTLFSADGQVIATKSVTLNAGTFQQAALSSYFPEIQGETHELLTLRVEADTDAALSVYASVIDNRSHDPIYVQALAAPDGNSLTIPVVGREPGFHDTFWRSDVTLFNPTSSEAAYTLRYSDATHELTLEARESTTLADVLSLFGIASGSAPLFISWEGGAGPVVASRTYTTTEEGATYGQSIEPIASLGSTIAVPGLRHDASFRSNLGFVNGGDEPETFSVVALSPSGAELARNNVTVAPMQHLQYPVSLLFPRLNTSAFTLTVQGDANAKLFAYGSMVDHLSGDPVFFSGR